jgi:hypothetical protein
VKLFVKAKAPLDIKDKRFDGTPLGWALHGWCDPPPEANRTGYYEVVARLVLAGGAADQDWLSHPHRESAMGRKIRSDRRMQAALKGRLLKTS